MYGEKCEKKNVFSKIRPAEWGIIFLAEACVQMTVYIDELILVNFVLDYLLLWGAGLLALKRRRRWRIALGAAVGGCYALVCSVCRWGPVLWLPVRVGVGVAMCFLVYGKRFWRAAGWFFALGCAMAGGVYVLSVFSGGRVGFLSGAVYVRIPAFLLLAAACPVWLGLTALCRIPALGRFRGREKKKVSLSCMGRCAEAEVFTDTGCMLRDPADNSAVLLISEELAKKLLPEASVLAMNGGRSPEKAVVLGGDFSPRLIFATGITGESPLFAFTVLISFGSGAKRRVTAAVSPFLGKEGIEALSGADLEKGDLDR